MSWRAGAVLIGLLSLTGCSNPGYFVCTLDSECTEADGSRCEPSGACSIPDASCPTGRRYGELGNPSIAGQCVPADDIGSTGSDPTMATAGASTGSSDGSSGSTTLMSSTSSSGQGSSTEAGSGSTSTSGSSSTGDPVPRDMWANCESAAECSELCAPIIDLVSQDPIAHWCTRFECEDPVIDCGDPGTGAVPDCLPLEFDGKVAPRCILDCTESGTAGCPEGMECFDVFMSPSRCAHPISE